jgi:hypothetical protein
VLNWIDKMCKTAKARKGLKTSQRRYGKAAGARKFFGSIARSKKR